MSFNFDQKLTLNESGKAIPSSSPISGDEALPLANKIISILQEKYPNTKFAPLGSTGKKDANETSGDIDIAIELDFNEAQNVEDFLKTKIANIETNHLNGFHILSFGYPYKNKSQENIIVQCDLMFFPNIELAKYFYHSPDFTKHESEFKGSIRNMLMLNILKFIPVKEKQNTTFENGHTKDLYKYSIQPEKGLVLIHQSFEGKKGQEIKTKKTIKEDTQIISDDTNFITHFMMGDEATDDTINSFESMIKWMKSDKFPYRNQNDKIFEGFYEYVERQEPENLSRVKEYINQNSNESHSKKLSLREKLFETDIDQTSRTSIQDAKQKSVEMFHPFAEFDEEIPSEIIKDFEDNCIDFIIKDKTILVKNLKTIPNKLFFCCDSLTSVFIPSSVTSIGSYTFCGCSSLTNIEIPSSVMFIGYNAFWGCTSLKQITLPKRFESKLKELGISNRVKALFEHGPNQISQTSIQDTKEKSVEMSNEVYYDTIKDFLLKNQNLCIHLGNSEPCLEFTKFVDDDINGSFFLKMERFSLTLRLIRICFPTCYSSDFTFEFASKANWSAVQKNKDFHLIHETDPVTGRPQTRWRIQLIGVMTLKEILDLDTEEWDAEIDDFDHENNERTTLLIPSPKGDLPFKPKHLLEYLQKYVSRCLNESVLFEYGINQTSQTSIQNAKIKAEENLSPNDTNLKRIIEFFGQDPNDLCPSNLTLSIISDGIENDGKSLKIIPIKTEPFHDLLKYTLDLCPSYFDDVIGIGLDSDKNQLVYIIKKTFLNQYLGIFPHPFANLSEYAIQSIIESFFKYEVPNIGHKKLMESNNILFESPPSQISNTDAVGLHQDAIIKAMNPFNQEWVDFLKTFPDEADDHITTCYWGERKTKMCDINPHRPIFSLKFGEYVYWVNYYYDTPNLVYFYCAPTEDSDTNERLINDFEPNTQRKLMKYLEHLKQKHHLE